MELKYREFNMDDLDELVAIMDDEWKYHTFGQGWEILIKLYAKHLLEESDYRMAVEDGGRLIGTLLMTTDYICEKQAGPDDVEMAMRFPNGDTCVREFNKIMDVDADLTSGIDHEKMGKVNLLILSKDSKGKHLGGKLLGDAIDHLKSKGRRGIFLMTDTWCNMGFYNHMGFELGGTTHVDTPELEYTMERAIYSMKF